MKTFLGLIVAFAIVFSTKADNEAKNTSDPCANVMCHKGRMCVPGDDMSTTCVCPGSCPEVSQPVCSVYNRQFNSTCHMHKFACRFGFFTTVKHKGRCTREEMANVDSGCPIERLLDFHERYLAWLMIAYNEANNINIENQDFDFDKVTNEERTKFIEWEFIKNDINSNGHLEPKEIKMMVDDREPCMVALLNSCDFDGKHGVSQHEWKTCFPIKLAGLEEQYVNEDL